MAGAAGYLVKPVPVSELLTAIQKTVHGLTVLCHRSQDLLVNGFRTFAVHAADLTLTRREEQLLAYLSERKSDKEIAEAMGITPGTVLPFPPFYGPCVLESGPFHF